MHQSAIARQAPILVVGGTGKTGWRVTERLTALGLPVRACSRASIPPFDWEDPRTWTPALSGAAAAYITYAPDLAMPKAAGRIAAFAECAVRADVPRLVLLSGRGEPGAQRSEEALQRTGVRWTILRASWFAQNFSEGLFLDAVLAGELALPVGDVREPFIDADDLADAVVAALTDDRHVGHLYELTGPRLLTFAEAAQEIGVASGRTLRYQQISTEAFVQGLAEQGTPPELSALMVQLFTEVLDGRTSATTGGVRQMLGREPRDFRQYAWAVAASGVWGRWP